MITLLHWYMYDYTFTLWLHWLLNFCTVDSTFKLYDYNFTLYDHYAFTLFDSTFTLYDYTFTLFDNYAFTPIPLLHCMITHLLSFRTWSALSRSVLCWSVSARNVVGMGGSARSWMTGITMWGCWSARDTSTSPLRSLSPCLNRYCKHI